MPHSWRSQDHSQCSHNKSMSSYRWALNSLGHGSCHQQYNSSTTAESAPPAQQWWEAYDKVSFLFSSWGNAGISSLTLYNVIVCTVDTLTCSMMVSDCRISSNTLHIGCSSTHLTQRHRHLKSLATLWAHLASILNTCPSYTLKSCWLHLMAGVIMEGEEECFYYTQRLSLTNKFESQAQKNMLRNTGWDEITSLPAGIH